MDLADVLPPADGGAEVREDWHGELVASLESVSDTLGLVTQLLSSPSHTGTYMESLSGSALLVRRPRTGRAVLGAGVLQQERDPPKVLHLRGIEDRNQSVKN